MADNGGGGSADATDQQGTDQQSPQVPEEITSRLDELAQFRDNVEPLLQQLQQQPQDEYDYEPGFGEEQALYYDPQTGQPVYPEEQEQQDPQVQALQQQLQEMQKQTQQLSQRFQAEEQEGLFEQYPQIGEWLNGPSTPDAQKFKQDVVQLADRLTGGDRQQADRLLNSTDFLENAYLARQAREQASQGVPGGDQQGVVLEGGSATPGQPQSDPTLDRFDQYANEGASSGPWGRPLV